MKWHRLFRSGVMTICLVSLGCGSRSLVAADPDLPARVAANGSDPATTRSQKPDKPPPSFLDVLPVNAREGGSGQIAARVRAVVNNRTILDEEVKAASYHQLLATRSLPEPERAQKQIAIWQAALEQLVDREVILFDAENKLKGPNAKVMEKLQSAASEEFGRQWVRALKQSTGIQNDDEFKAFLREQGLSLETVRRQWERNFIATEYLKMRVYPYLEKPGLQQLREYYETHPEQFQVEDNVTWQDVFISIARHGSREAAQGVAQDLIRRARAGQDFAKLAKEFDDGDSTLRNGEGIGRKHGEIKPPEAEGYLFQMRDGDIGPIVELSTGFHVIRLVKREYAGRKPFDVQVQIQIREKLRQDIAQREMKKFLNELKKTALIEYSRTSD
jgi:peptidyl-prolyl cis-trans isomerase SurA